MTKRNIPNINPAGTRYRRVRLRETGSNRFTHVGRAVFAVIGEYIKADYAVTVKTYHEDGYEVVDVTCEPPLFEGMLP